MSAPLTESSDMKIWQEQKWKLTPLHVPVLAVDIPESFIEIRDAELQEEMPGDFALIWLSRKRSMDRFTHQTLLEESLREYSEIWRTLAEK